MAKKLDTTIGSFWNNSDRDLNRQGPATAVSEGQNGRVNHLFGDRHTHFIFTPSSPFGGFWGRSRVEQDAIDSRARLSKMDTDAKLASRGYVDQNDSPAAGVIVLVMAIIAAVVGSALAIRKMPKQFSNIVEGRKRGTSLVKVVFGLAFTAVLGLAGFYYGAFYWGAFIGAKAASIFGSVLGGLTGLGLGVYFGKYMAKLFYWVKGNKMTTSDPFTLSRPALNNLSSKYGVSEECANTMLTYLTQKMLAHKEQGSSETTVKLFQSYRKVLKSGKIPAELYAYFSTEMRLLAQERSSLQGRSLTVTSELDELERDYTALDSINTALKDRKIQKVLFTAKEVDELNHQSETGLDLGDVYTPGRGGMRNVGEVRHIRGDQPVHHNRRFAP